MSYDPSDERLESLMDDIIRAFDSCPPRLRKMLLVHLFDKISLLNVLVKENGLPAGEDVIGRLRETRWEDAEGARIEEARKFLYMLMSQELP